MLGRGVGVLDAQSQTDATLLGDSRSHDLAKRKSFTLTRCNRPKITRRKSPASSFTAPSEPCRQPGGPSSDEERRLAQNWYDAEGKAGQGTGGPLAAPAAGALSYIIFICLCYSYHGWAANCMASRCIILDALHSRNIYFRKLRKRPMLTAENAKARMAFACKCCKYRLKSKAWWLRHMRAFMNGGKFF